MITNKVLDKAITIGELWIYSRLMSGLERSLQFTVVDCTPLFSFAMRETTYIWCNSGFELSAAVLKWLEVCKTQDECKSHKLLRCSKFLLLTALFKEMHIIQQSRFSLHMFKTAAGASAPLGFLEQHPAVAPLGCYWNWIAAATGFGLGIQSSWKKALVPLREGNKP